MDPANVEHGLVTLVLTIVELLRQLMERQAIRRVDQGDLTDGQIEQVGSTLMALDGRMAELCDYFEVTREDLNLDLGPLGPLLGRDLSALPAGGLLAALRYQHSHLVSGLAIATGVVRSNSDHVVAGRAMGTEATDATRIKRETRATVPAHQGRCEGARGEPEARNRDRSQNREQGACPLGRVQDRK